MLVSPKVRLVVLNYDGGDDVLVCIDSLLALDWPADDLELVVVDNDSADGSADEIEARFPHVRLIRNRDNTGFSANNLALDDLDGIDHVGLVNPDARVDPDWLAPLVDALTADHSLGAACPRILLDSAGTDPFINNTGPFINNTGVVPRELGYFADRGLGEPDGPPYDESAEVFGWTGGGVLLRADYLRDVGLFDDLFFLYYEDVDLSWRGRARGWRYRYVPAATMHHRHAATTREGSDLFRFQNERNRLLVLIKNAPWTFVARALFRFLVSTLGHLRADVILPIAQRRQPDSSEIHIRARAAASLVRDARRIAAARRHAQRVRTEPHDSVLHWLRPS
ncbi:MAG: glycosyltransferase family 2 protein [Acidimicrobiales bacterium]|nr:glycosyltransferase family 2 protein [Acidimicrobiales bacterium]